MSSRVQLALNVNDIDEAVAFYARLFGAGPAKRRPGYANFAIAEPPLKLVLLENPGHGGSLNHLGIEVPDIEHRRRRAGPARRNRASPPSMSARPPAATPGRTSSGSRARPTASAGRSTRSWPTARPSTAKATAGMLRSHRPARRARPPPPPAAARSQPAAQANALPAASSVDPRKPRRRQPQSPGPADDPVRAGCHPLRRQGHGAANGPERTAARPSAPARRGRASSRPRCRGARRR